MYFFHEKIRPLRRIAHPHVPIHSPLNRPKVPLKNSTILEVNALNLQHFPLRVSKQNHSNRNIFLQKKA